MANIVGMYASSASITDGLLAELQNIFDTAQDFPEIPPQEGYIRRVPDAEWAIGQTPAEIYARHCQTHVPEYLTQPVIVLDERTVVDKSVLVLAQILTEDDEFVLHGVRFHAAKVPGMAMNIEISNQDLFSYLDAEYNGLETVNEGDTRIQDM